MGRYGHGWLYRRAGQKRAAQTNWREVEPAIFGTLLERALDPAERHAMGAHFTPRAYVERLVLPTVIEPLRAEWADAQTAALMLAHEAASLEANPVTVASKTDFAAADRHAAAVRAKWREARQVVKDFHHRLCTVVVLDPACDSGNFLYVTLEHLKRLEGEVLNQLADLVLWMGYLHWHIRTQGNAAVAEPVVHDYGNCFCKFKTRCRHLVHHSQLNVAWRCFMCIRMPRLSSARVLALAAG